MKNEQIDTIYLDMDGVCADMWKLADKLTSWIFFDMLSAQEQQQVLSHHIRNNKHFYQQVQPYEYAKQLYDLCKRSAPRVCFLSGFSTKSDTEFERVAHDKIEWVRKYIDPSIPDSDIIIVRDHKKQYATPTSLLIDDNPKNIQAWRSNGGIGITFKGYKPCKFQMGRLAFVKQCMQKQSANLHYRKILQYQQHHR